MADGPFLPFPVGPKELTREEIQQDIVSDVLDLVNKISLAQDPENNYTANRINFAEMTGQLGEVCDLGNPRSVQSCISTYFQICKINDSAPSLPGLSNALGISFKHLNEIRNPEANRFSRDALSPSCRRIILRACDILDQVFVQMIHDQRITAPAATYLGSNFHNMHSKTEHKIDFTKVTEIPRSMEDIAEEFSTLPDILVEDVEYKDVKEPPAE